MGSLEDRLQRLRSVEISNGGEAGAPGSAPPPAKPAISGRKHEISDKAANLIATALKDFLRTPGDGG